MPSLKYKIQQTLTEYTNNNHHKIKKLKQFIISFEHLIMYFKKIDWSQFVIMVELLNCKLNISKISLNLGEVRMLFIYKFY